MADLDRAVATQLANIEKRTGRTLAELTAVVKGSGLEKHGEMVAMLKRSLGMGHGDANTLVHLVRRAEEGEGAGPGAPEDVLDGLYTGAKSALRPIHDRLLKAIERFGPFDEAPKKSYVSYRRKKQFATIGPATSSQVEVGLNAKGLEAEERLQKLPAGQMCNYRVRISAEDEVDDRLIGWLRAAYEGAG
jgi:predicted transport protein